MTDFPPSTDLKDYDRPDDWAQWPDKMRAEWLVQRLQDSYGPATIYDRIVYLAIRYLLLRAIFGHGTWA